MMRTRIVVCLVALVLAVMTGCAGTNLKMLDIENPSIGRVEFGLEDGKAQIRLGTVETVSDLLCGMGWFEKIVSVVPLVSCEEPVEAEEPIDDVAAQ